LQQKTISSVSKILCNKKKADALAQGAIVVMHIGMQKTAETIYSVIPLLLTDKQGRVPSDMFSELLERHADECCGLLLNILIVLDSCLFISTPVQSYRSCNDVISHLQIKRLD
jgi:hypothetical protein